MKMIADYFEYAEFNGDAHFYHFYPEIVFLSKSGPQIQKCQYKLKFATQTNSNIQKSSMVLFRFSVSALQFLFEESI